MGKRIRGFRLRKPAPPDLASTRLSVHLGDDSVITVEHWRTWASGRAWFRLDVDGTGLSIHGTEEQIERLAVSLAAPTEKTG